MIIALIIIAALILIYFFMIYPAPASKAARSAFAKRNYAHRGFYDNETARPENTLPAFEAAMQRGYGCELDVQFTSDKKLIVFHDNDYKRSSGVNKKVWEVSYDEAKKIKLFNSDETVPLFSEVLETVAGREPLIVEIKAEGVNCKWYYEVCEATLKLLREYHGVYCVESFHPMVVRWFKKNAPDLVRGQLVNGWRRWKRSIPTIAALAIDKQLSNVLARPNFIAYHEEDVNRSLRLVQKLGALTVMWTVRNEERLEELKKTEDAIIFEKFAPDTKY